MSIFTRLAQSVWNGWNADGSPRRIDPQEAVIWGTEVERSLLAFQAGGGIIFQSVASMSLAYAANQMAWVLGDANAANNGIYQKIGGSGSGSWVRRGDLPYSFIRLSNVGTGTPNAIRVTSAIPTSPSVMRVANVFAANTGNVTISENGGGAKPLLTNSGNQIASGGLVPGMMLVYVDNGSSFRLLNDQVSAAIVAAAEAALADFRTQYLGKYASNPATDPAGGTLQEGSFYWNTTSEAWFYWDGDSFEAFPFATVVDGGITKQKMSDSAVDARSIDGSDNEAIRSKLKTRVETRGNLLTRMMAGAAIRGMYLRKTGGGFNVGFGMAKAQASVVEYNLVYNADNFLSLRQANSGTEDNQQQALQPTLSGTFNTTTPPNAYTTAVNDTFSSTFTGSNLFFEHYANNQGGVWEFTLTSGPCAGRKQIVSTFSTSVVAQKRVPVFENLPYGTHGVVAKFLGADPYNAPSGGTARGWLRYNVTPTASQRALHYAKIKSIASNSIRPTSSPLSIQDFAIAARPNSMPGIQTQWVPIHSDVAGVSLNINLRILIDGDIITSTAGDLPADFTFREGEKIEILQSFDAINPNGGTAMWKHTISHSFDVKEGFVRIRNRILILQDTFVSAGYLSQMGVVRTILPAEDNMTRLVYNNGTELDPIPSGDFETQLGADVTSAMYAGLFNPSSDANIWHGCAIHVESLMESSSQGKRVQPVNAAMQTGRTDGIVKTYWRLAANSVLLAGEVYTSETHIAAIAGVRAPNDMLYMI